MLYGFINISAEIPKPFCNFLIMLIDRGRFLFHISDTLALEPKNGILQKGLSEGLWAGVGPLPDMIAKSYQKINRELPGKYKPSMK